MASVTCDAIEKITIAILHNIGYQNDLMSITKTIGSPKKSVNPICNAETQPERPDTLFFLPEEAGATDYKMDADVNDLEVAENLCGARCHPLGCSQAFVSLAELIMEDNNLHFPQDPDEATSLYLDLLYHIDNL